MGALFLSSLIPQTVVRVGKKDDIYEGPASLPPCTAFGGIQAVTQVSEAPFPYLSLRILVAGF